MYKSILVPLDGSAFAEEALPTAIRLARATHATLTLVRVTDRLRDLTPDRAERYLERIGAEVEQRTGVTSQRVVRHGGVAAVIRKEALDRHADLVVMTTHALGPVGRVFTTSVADKVARSAPCPVLFVHREHKGHDWNVHRRFMHVLVPVDGSRAAEQALRMGLQLADLDDARVTILHVAQPELAMAASHGTLPGHGVAHIEPEETERMSRDYLESLAEWVQDQRSRPFTNVRIKDGAPVDEIVAFAADNGVDLIALTTRGLGGVRRLVLGSTASAVLRRANTAVLLLPPHVAG
jgi:nucleotide-binding universal stress UspA family protein